MKYHENESTTVEFKREIPKNGHQIAKTIVGFCNQFGGKLIFGIDDNKDICGVEESNIDDVIQSLQQLIFRSCTPTIIPSIYTQRIYNKLILIVEVSAGMNKPYFISALGINDGTFIRAGAHTVKATFTMLQELTWKNKGFAIDEMPVYASSVEEINKEKFINFLNEHRSHFNKSEINELLFHYKILIEEHKKNYPTLGGVLLFGQNPQQYFPESFIICSHFQGTHGRHVIATIDCTGDLFSQLNSAIGFVMSRLNKQFVITHTKREESLEIPEIALREAIINAIVHRDYYLPGPIKIAIYDDRIEIFSPGNFPGPLKSTQLESGITYIRNHVICKIFREAGYIEKLGSGFLTIFNSYREYRLPLPEVIDGNGFIKCVLPRKTKAQLSENTNEEQDEILRLFFIADEMSAQEIAAHLNISRQTAARRLSKLVNQGKLKKLGKGPAVKYAKL
jgi:ATP-dependent DNA helicase RecG